MEHWAIGILLKRTVLHLQKAKLIPKMQSKRINENENSRATLPYKHISSECCLILVQNSCVART